MFWRKFPHLPGLPPEFNTGKESDMKRESFRKYCLYAFSVNSGDTQRFTFSDENRADKTFFSLPHQKISLDAKLENLILLILLTL